jgi:carboxypeptidase Taq
VSYPELVAHYRRISHLSHVSSMARWDEAVMMPTGGGDARAEALATLDGLVHELGTDPRIGDWLERASSAELGETERASVREMARVYRRATALPQELVEAQSRAQLRCEQAWRAQRRENDWAGHRPLLEEVVRHKRAEAALLSSRFELPAYDALMDAFEPGMSSERVDAIFDALESFLPGAMQEAIEKQQRRAPLPIVGPFEIAEQKALGMALMRAVGFDFEHGRLDTSHHPFCGGVPDDVRITTRYNEQDFTESLMGVLHETGHAKYEQGLPRALRDLPVGQARSMGVHESQSLFQEMQICRGLPFLTFAERFVREAFPVHAGSPTLSAENLARLYTTVERGYIRVDADEVTYPLHVILRYRIERALISGTLEVRDIPDAWDEHMKRALGLSTAGNYQNGCMQDVHWPSGAFGYFPSYTLGALIAAQLFEAAAQQLPELPAQIERGEFEPLNAFLRERVWSAASLYDTSTLVARATGAALGPEAFIRHVKRRYLS